MWVKKYIFGLEVIIKVVWEDCFFDRKPILSNLSVSDYTTTKWILFCPTNSLMFGKSIFLYKVNFDYPKIMIKFQKSIDIYFEFHHIRNHQQSEESSKHRIAQVNTISFVYVRAFNIVGFFFLRLLSVWMSGFLILVPSLGFFSFCWFASVVFILFLCLL